VKNHLNSNCTWLAKKGGKMSSLRWKIGDVEVFQIIELEAGALIQSIIKNATPENIRNIGWLYPHFADKEGNLKALVQGFLIKSNKKNILIDTCNGNDKSRTDVPEWSNLKIDFIGRLAEVGVTPSEIDVVACTHLHMDHVGWNTKLENGNWVPTFPNARYLFAQKDYDYWVQKPEKEIADDKAAFDDSVSPIIKAGLATLIHFDHEIDKNISFIPTPGHTPGHVSVRIDSQGEHGIISGDFLHHPCQIAEPTWFTDADTIPDQGIETRIRLLDLIADSETLLIGSHFANPVAGRVQRKNGKLTFVV
jgi:glyoxylase-like metal-dependent hydrolase (beta-lactamase superfamily II)